MPRQAIAAVLLVAPLLAGARFAPGPDPVARHVEGVPAVGALFAPGSYPLLHTCTAVVVRSAGGDVIMTAAHCVTGSGAGYRFAPGYRDGRTPYGVWQITAAYADPAWVSHQDPHRDWVFLRVARQRIGRRVRSLQSVTGGYRLGRTAPRGRRVTVIGYALGRDDTPLRCRAGVYRHYGYPAFDCGGYVAGTSGSPWLLRTSHGAVIAGDIGGLHQGGCRPATSYSPFIGRRAHHALARAAAGGPGDLLPVPGSDGCG